MRIRTKRWSWYHKELWFEFNDSWDTWHMWYFHLTSWGFKTVLTLEGGVLIFNFQLGPLGWVSSSDFYAKD